MAGNTFTEKIKIQLQGAKKAAAGGKKVESSLKKIQKAAVMAGGSFFAAQGIINGMKHIISLSMETEKVGQAFQAMGSNFGIARMDLDKLRQAVNGTVSDLDLMTEANNALTLGVADSVEQLADMFDGAQRLGKALGLNTTQAVNSLVTGMGRQSKLMLDNLGIIVDAETAYKNYAREMGIVNRTLDDNEKKLAFNNETVRQLNTSVKLLGDESLSTSENMAALTTSAEGFFSTETAFAMNVISRLFQDIGLGAKDGEVGISTFKEAFNALVDVDNLSGFALEFKAGLDMMAPELDKAGLSVDELMVGLNEALAIDPDLIIEGVSTLRTYKDGFGGFKTEIDNSTASMSGLQFQAKEMDKIIQAFISDLMEYGDLNRGQTTLLVTYLMELERIVELEKERGQLRVGVGLEEIEIQNLYMRGTEDSNSLQLEKFRNFEIEIDYVNNLKNLYDDFSKSLSTLTKDQVDSAMAVGAAQKNLASAAGASATAFIIAELQKSIALYITDAFAKGGILGGIAGAATSGIVGNLFKGAIGSAETVFAAEGYDGIVTEPTMFVAGEAGAEYVDIDPLTNEAGGGGGKGSTIIFQGNVMSQDFIEAEAIPMIKEALRKGGDIGIG